MTQALTVELCSDTGCGLYMTEIAGTQYRISLMPDEHLEALARCGEPKRLKDFLLEIDPSFAPACAALGLEAIAAAIRAKPLPSILKRMAERARSR